MQTPTLRMHSERVFSLVDQNAIVLNRQGMKILVVDDEAGVRDFCGQALRLAGHEVLTVASGEEAVLRLGEGWDIILTDLTMPGAVDGNELVRRTRVRGNTDVLLMTANPGLDTAI